MTVWADYSGGVPSGTALSAAGITGVIRYVGVGGGSSLPHKRLTRVEYADLVAAGRQVLAVVELGTGDADTGYDGGVANARAAVADLAAITAGLPPIRYVFAANDKPGWSQVDVDYVRGFRDVLGIAATGAYGFASFLQAVRAAGLAAVYWQAGEPPSATGTADFVHLWQRNGYDGTPTGATVDGVDVDLNNQQLPLEADVALTPDDVSSIWYTQIFTDPATQAKYNGGQVLWGLRVSLDALGGTLAQHETDLLAAIRAETTGTVDATALATALETAGLPGAIVTALLAALAKAAA